MNAPWVDKLAAWGKKQKLRQKRQSGPFETGDREKKRILNHKHSETP